MNILVVEDEQDLRDLIVHHMQQGGHHVDSAVSGTEAWIKIRARKPNLILLDMNLPGMDGLELLRVLRADPKLQGTGVLVVTARTAEQDVLDGLSAGADDYIGKPFRAAELLARVEAVGRRLQSTAATAQIHSDEPDAVFRAGPLLLDRQAHQIFADGVGALALSPTEFSLLVLLMERSRRVVDRDAIVTHIWGAGERVNHRTVDAYVTRLRTKLGTHADCIVAVRGLGYRLESS